MIKLIKSTFYKERETKRGLIAFIKKAKQLSFGSECEKFERNFSAYQGRKYCVFVNSGSSANLVLIQSLLNIGRLKKGDRVGFSMLSWATNVMPLIQLGLVPVPIDVELDTLNVSSRTFSVVLKSHPLKALFVTNLLGFCGDLDTIKNICDRKNILLLEDTCEALGSEYRGKKLGNFGLASTFSFFVGHHMSTIEGGAVCTDDKELANAMRMARAHGWDRQFSEADKSKIRRNHRIDPFYGNYTFYHLGFNVRPTEINGFLGNYELQNIKKMIAIRSKNFKIFSQHLSTMGDTYIPLNVDHMDRVSNFAIPVLCRTKEIQKALIQRCAGVVEIRPIVGGDLTQQFFFKEYGPHHVSKRHTNAELVHEQGLYFANNPHLSSQEIKTILSVL